MKKLLLSFLISMISFSLIFVGVDKLIFSRDNSTIAVDGEDGDISLEKPEPKHKDELLVLLMGVDSKDVKKSKGTRTDTMMLVKVNFESGKINLLSIPRDTRVMVKGKPDKMNHAHAYGGSDLTIQTVRDFLNIDLDYYVKVDYRAVMEIVDAIGGVEIDVPRNMKYNDPTADPPLNINISKGLQTLDGKNAHDFLRWRHNNSYTAGYADGDIGRIGSQQMFMKELVKQTLKAKNIFKLPSLIETYYDYVETNVPLKTILKGAMSAKSLDTENMETVTIPGNDKTIDKLSYWIYNEEETRQVVETMFGDYLLD